MRCLIPISALLAGLTLASPAWADPPGPAAGPRPTASPDLASEGPSWPEALKKRNARYARLDRALDAAGDEHERVLAEAHLVRWQDRRADHEEEVRYVAGLKVPPRASRHAAFARSPDRPSDEHQAMLATLGLSRRHADFRRLRDLTGDMGELARWNRDLIKYGDPRLDGARVHLAEREEDRAGVRRAEQDEERAASLEVEKAEQRQEQDEERQIAREEEGDRGPGLILGRGDEAELEREIEREIEKTLDKAERAVEKTLDKVERDLEKDLDRVEAAEERAGERQDERKQDREEDQTLQQTESELDDED